jgi:hypothetical protein
MALTAIARPCHVIIKVFVLALQVPYIGNGQKAHLKSPPKKGP